MINLTVLSSKDITKLVNLKSKKKGIEVTHIEINNGINFSGSIFNTNKGQAFVYNWVKF